MAHDNLGEERARTLEGKYWCPLDNEAFDTEAQLEEHYRTEHPREKLPARGQAQRRATGEGDGAGGDHQRASQIARHLHDLIGEVRQSVEAVSDPRAKALFETTAETLNGLETAFEHYQAQSEPAWRD